MVGGDGIEPPTLSV